MRRVRLFRFDRLEFWRFTSLSSEAIASKMRSRQSVGPDELSSSQERAGRFELLSEHPQDRLASVRKTSVSQKVL
jgi:hypothetical protein